MTNKEPIPKFATEAEEAQWWYEQRDLLGERADAALARPYILTDAVLITLLFLWSRLKENREDRPSRAAVMFTPFLVAASAWIHGSWYLLVLPAVVILFTGSWRCALWYGGCWLAGSFLGGALTGHPWEFLFQSVRHMFGVVGHFVVNRQLES